MACSCVGTGDFAEDVEGLFWEASGLAWTHGTACGCAQRPPLERSKNWLPRKEHEGSVPICVCGNAQGVRADWFTPFWQQKAKLDQSVVRHLEIWVDTKFKKFNKFNKFNLFFFEKKKNKEGEKRGPKGAPSPKRAQNLIFHLKIC